MTTLVKENGRMTVTASTSVNAYSYLLILFKIYKNKQTNIQKRTTKNRILLVFTVETLMASTVTFELRFKAFASVCLTFFGPCTVAFNVTLTATL